MGQLSVTVKVFSSDPSFCLPWADSQNVIFDNGAFAIEVGHVINRIGGAARGAAVDFKQAFINNSSLSISSATCASGNSYTPASADDRLLSATFTEVR